MYALIFSKNQNAPCNPSFKKLSGPYSGAARISATTKHASATAHMNHTCTRAGCFPARNTQYAPTAAVNNAGNASSQFIQCTFGNGRSQPPRNSVVATAPTTIMLVYSPRKYSAQRKPLNSVM